MKSRKCYLSFGSVLAFVALFLLTPHISWSQGEDLSRSTAGGGLPDFDVRLGKEGQAIRQSLRVPSADAKRVADLKNGIDAAQETLKADDLKLRCPDIRRARELLGWEPKVSLEEGLRRTIEYFRKRLA